MYFKSTKHHGLESDLTLLFNSSATCQAQDTTKDVFYGLQAIKEGLSEA